MTPLLRVGCAMWAHAAWPGRYVPGGRTPADALASYAAMCNAVEGNTTFYALPSAAVAASWAAQAPADFRIVCKLPQAVTHHRRLRHADEPMRAFMAAIEPLGDRAAQWSVQLPASFGPDELDVLAAFLRSLPAHAEVGVEVRHPDFFAEGAARTNLLRVLDGVGADAVVLDSRVLFAAPPTSDAERDAWSVKPRVPVHERAVGPRPVVRMIGRDDLDATRDGLRRWVPVVAGWLAEGRSPTVFVHTPDNVHSPLLARQFHEWVRAEVPALAPLPEPPPVGAPAQPSLFE